MLVFDTEVNYRKKTIEDIGAITNRKREFHSGSLPLFLEFIKKQKPAVFAGHNILAFDMVFLSGTEIGKYITIDNVIDTLYLSALLFPKKPYHKLVKDDKLVADYVNNPLNDAKKARDLLEDCRSKFERLDDDFKNILYLLLKDKSGVKPFFTYIKFKPQEHDAEELIAKRFSGSICLKKNIKELITKYPFELSFVLSYINTADTHNSLLPAWIINCFSKTENILTYLRSTPCGDESCPFCGGHLSAHHALGQYFGYSSFKLLNGVNLQEQAVNSALNNESLIAVFPTGGGKSLTFQLPALMAGENIGGLTVVISPLQSLMKDQVDNLISKNIIEAAFINGLLNPIERKHTIERVADGSVDILYISPESLRSKTIENLLLKRQIVRFVIDEAHCFSTWGQDFRVDYLYIGDFIKNIAKKKELSTVIPVSCFTATAKQNVISDICAYFKTKLNIEMKRFITAGGRSNLDYHVLKVGDDEDRYFNLRRLLEGDDRPTIIYAARIKAIEALYNRLRADGFRVSKFHGQMDAEEKIKHQNAFMNNETAVMVATNAFGMGVDKRDVGAVIHYHISDSLENYVQEAGRAGRDEVLRAKCYILYNENDLDMHFNLLSHSKINIKEISQIWQGIKKITKEYPEFAKTTLEIGKIAGWEKTDNDTDIRIKTCILALEDVKYINRGLDSPRVYASSLLVKNFFEAEKLMRKTRHYKTEDIEISKRIVKSLISKKSHSWVDEVAESRVDYLADHLGIEKKVIITHINILREIGILEDHNDLYARMDENIKARSLITALRRYREIFGYLIECFQQEQKLYNLKVLNEGFTGGAYKSNIKYLGIALTYLALVKIIKLKRDLNRNFYAEMMRGKEEVSAEINKYFDISEFIIYYLTDKYYNKNELKTKALIDFSSIELRDAYLKHLGLIKDKTTVADIESAILMLEKLDVLAFEGGFLVIYSPLTIKRLDYNPQTRYTAHEYEKLSNYYINKNRQIHIVGRYADMMAESEDAAKEYVSDYFNIDYMMFLDKYFPGKLKKELDMKMSKNRYEKLFGNLSPEQKQIIEDGKEKLIGVVAGPGSGKTTLLVNKLASIIYNEDIKVEQLLMLTFSRNAAIEFQDRLKMLINDVANYITITTFHSYAFDILGRPGSVEHSANVVKEAVELIRAGEAETFKITKMMLVIDEAQDMSADEFDLVMEIMKHNDDLRVMAVGDDDQNIYEFRGSSSKYLKVLAKNKQYELTVNFRSKNNIVAFTNQIISINKNRLKKREITSHTKENGKVTIITYLNNNLIMPLVRAVIKEAPAGTTAIITRTNEEALLVHGVLTDRNVKSKLIRDMREVRPFNIYEIRCFYEMLGAKTENKIDFAVWNDVLREHKSIFGAGKHYDAYEKMLDKFIGINTASYMTDLKEFLYETDIAYFSYDKSITVANIHKTKGMEFDNVYVLYENRGFLNEEEIRALYVGLTRAKNNLNIFTTNALFSAVRIPNVKYINVNEVYKAPPIIELAFSLQDVYLDYYESVKNNLAGLLPGDKLYLHHGYLMYEGKRVGRLSKKGALELTDRKAKGYMLEQIEVLNNVYWYNKETEKEILIMIPKLKFRLVR